MTAATVFSNLVSLQPAEAAAVQDKPVKMLTPLVEMAVMAFPLALTEQVRLEPQAAAAETDQILRQQAVLAVVVMVVLTFLWLKMQQLQLVLAEAEADQI